MDPWSGLDDGQLATLARGGQPEAYGELARRYQAEVYHVVYRLVGARQEALDLAQEALVRAYHGLDSFDAARPFGPWLRRVAANLALNWLERRRPPTVPLQFEAPTEEQSDGERALPDYSAEPERLYLAGERQALVRRAILALPPRYRAVIELRHFQDLTYDEIAATLGLPLSDIKSHLFRARQMLRRHLERVLSAER